MKINIFLDIKSGPYGGGNQFLKALRDFFIKKDVYSTSAKNADVILFNSHHKATDLIKLKKKYPEKVFVHRLDGPVFLIRNDNIFLDKMIYSLNSKIADATIFQSDWSRNRNIELGLDIGIQEFQDTIINAPNSSIFNKKNKKVFKTGDKLKIIATSWASNMSKGFEAYKYLDDNLDFTKYEMTFCGNSPIEFVNIKHIKPLPSNELTEQLKQHDVFITASQKDPCSNSLIEALHCGLPAIGLNDGGHPEIIKQGGLVFDKKQDIIPCLEQIRLDYTFFEKQINLPTMIQVGQDYLSFIQNVYKKTSKPKKINPLIIMRLYKSFLLFKINKLK